MSHNNGEHTTPTLFPHVPGGGAPGGEAAILPLPHGDPPAQPMPSPGEYHSWLDQNDINFLELLSTVGDFELTGPGPSHPPPPHASPHTSSQGQLSPEHYLQGFSAAPQHTPSQATPPQPVQPAQPVQSAPPTAPVQPTPPTSNGTRKREVQPRLKIRPCDHCRRRKTKCVVNPDTNNCVQCEAKRLKCTYEYMSNSSHVLVGDQAKKRARGDKPGGTPSEGLVPMYVSGLPPQGGPPIRDAAPVHDYALMRGPSLLKRTLLLQYPRLLFYIGPTLVLDARLFHRAQLDKVDLVQLLPTVLLRRVADLVQFTLRDDYTDDLYHQTEQDVDAVERLVLPHGLVLVDLYFRIIHPSFPILHKKVFLEKYLRTHREFLAPLLLAVYVLAIQWWDYDPRLSQHPRPNVAALHQLAVRTFRDVIERPKLLAVQAGLLLLQCRPDHSTNWLTCSQVVALSEELGLGLDCTDWRLPQWERGLRRRLAWAVYIQDKWLALIELRPLHINESNWMPTAVLADDFPEKHGDGDLAEGATDIEEGKMLFRELILLLEILLEIINMFFTMRAMEQVTRLDQVLRLAKPLQLRLRQWYHLLPPLLQMQVPQLRKLCLNGYLHLAYFATEITLHRRIILLLRPDTPADLVRVCRSAAETRLQAAIEFVKELKPEHIHAFWHSLAAANFALIGTFALLLYVTLQLPEEAATYKDHLFNYRWILRVSAKGFDQALLAVDKLDMLIAQIPGLMKDQLQGLRDPAFQGPPSMSLLLVATSRAVSVVPEQQAPLAGLHLVRQFQALPAPSAGLPAAFVKASPTP